MILSSLYPLGSHFFGDFDTHVPLLQLKLLNREAFVLQVARELRGYSFLSIWRSDACGRGALERGIGDSRRRFLMSSWFFLIFIFPLKLKYNTIKQSCPVWADNSGNGSHKACHSALNHFLFGERR
jgi:hypothetical protein